MLKYANNITFSHLKRFDKTFLTIDKNVSMENENDVINNVGIY